MNKIPEKLKAIISIVIVITIITVCLGITAACDTSGSSNRLTISTTKLMVGSDTTFPPFEYMEEGKTIGFDIDIASEIAERLEKELQIIPITWDSTYDIQKDTKVDMVISAISRAEDKEELVDFSEPYYVLEYLLITLSEAKLKLKEDLQDKKIGMLTNKEEDLSAQYLKNFSIESYNDIILMIDGLKNKDIEGMLISVTLGKSIIDENNGLFDIIEIVQSEKEYNIVFHEGSLLKPEVDRILEEMEQDGTYEEIHDKWFAISD